MKEIHRFRFDSFKDCITGKEITAINNPKLIKEGLRGGGVRLEMSKSQCVKAEIQDDIEGVLTIIVSFKAEKDQSSYANVFNNEYSSSTGGVVIRKYGDKFVPFFGNGSAWVFNDNDELQFPLVPGKWQRVAFAIGQVNKSIFINGDLHVSAQSSQLPTKSIQPFGIGFRPERNDNYFNGIIEDLRIFKGELTAKQVKEEFKNPDFAVDPAPINPIKEQISPRNNEHPQQVEVKNQGKVVAEVQIIQINEAKQEILKEIAGLEQKIGQFGAGEEIKQLCDQISKVSALQDAQNEQLRSMQAIITEQGKQAQKLSDENRQQHQAMTVALQQAGQATMLLKMMLSKMKGHQ